MYEITVLHQMCVVVLRGRTGVCRGEESRRLTTYSERVKQKEEKEEKKEGKKKKKNKKKKQRERD